MGHGGGGEKHEIPAVAINDFVLIWFILIFNLNKHFPQKLQSLPLLKSTQECTQDLNSENLVSSSTCTEMHTYRPFSRGTSGATTEVTQKLTYSRKSRGTNTRQGMFTNSTILFLINFKKEMTRHLVRPVYIQIVHLHLMECIL